MKYFCLFLVCVAARLCAAESESNEANAMTKRFKFINPFTKFGYYYKIFSLGHVEGVIDPGQQENLAFKEVNVDFSRIWKVSPNEENADEESEEEFDDSLENVEAENEDANMATHHYGHYYGKCLKLRLCGFRPCTVCYKQCIIVRTASGPCRILCSHLCHSYHHCLKKRRHCYFKYQKYGCGNFRRGRYYRKGYLHPFHN